MHKYKAPIEKCCGPQCPTAVCEPVIDYKGLVYELFKNSIINDEKVHNFAAEKNIDKHTFENAIYDVLNSIINGGVSPQMKIQISEEALEQGSKVELEHTYDLELAKKIARDHLAESFPLNYYDYLAQMEKIIEQDKKNLK